MFSIHNQTCRTWSQMVLLATWSLVAIAACSSTGKEDEAVSKEDDAPRGQETSIEIEVEEEAPPQVSAGDDSGAYNGGTLELTDKEAQSLTGDACGGFSYEGEVLPSVIQLVVDVSSSMRSGANGTGDRSKWEVTRDLLLEGIVGVEGRGLPASVSVGLLFYPNRPDVQGTPHAQEISACVNVDEFVSAEVLGGEGAVHRELIRGAIEDAVTEKWTPTHDAYRYALEHGILDARLPGSKFMLLITDGSPTVSLECIQSEEEQGGSGVDPEPIVEEIARAAAEGVRTFLIGSPGSEGNREWMSRAAVIGGSAPVGCSVNGPVGEYCHMDMTAADDFTQALRDGLERVAGVISSCAFELNKGEQVVDQDAVNVILTDKEGTRILVGRDDHGTCDEGWRFNDEGQVELCKTTCSQLQLDPDMSIELAFGCVSQVVVR